MAISWAKVKSYRAYERIKRVIRKGRLAPDYRMTGAKIVDLLGTNHGTVRESLFRLEAEESGKSPGSAYRVFGRLGH